MMQPNQVAGNQAPEAQQIRGTMSQMQRGQQEREQATRQTEAKIAETEARAMFGANRAEYAPQMSEAELAQKQANTGLTQARATTAQVDAQYAAARQQARIAEMRARAAQGDAESERKLAEVDVLLGLTPEEAKTAKTQRETERKSRSTEPAPSSQQSQSGSPDEREAFIRSLAAEAGIEMEDTGNIKNDVMSTIKRLDGAKGMLANTQRNKWLGILAKAEQKYR
jgi:hypothetical protein